MKAHDNLSVSACLDCGGPVATGVVDGEFTIIHVGNGCDGFRERFSDPLSTRAMNEKGEVVAIKHPPAKLKKGEETPK